MDSASRVGRIRIEVITVSDRSAAGEREDLSGPAAIELLEAAGIRTVGSRLIPDGANSVKAALTESVADRCELILTLGGTGIGPRDETPEGTLPLLERQLPGIPEALRGTVRDRLPTAVFSRDLAGVTEASADGHRTVIVNLPGSPGGVRDGIGYLLPLLPHLLDQVSGGDH